MLPGLERLEATRQALVAQVQESEARFLGPGQRLRDALQAGRPVDEAIAKPVHDLTEGILRRAIAYKELAAKTMLEVACLLDENQKQRVQDFVPCLVPTSDLREPERIGSLAASSDGAASVLDKARKVPGWLFWYWKRKALDKVMLFVKALYDGVDADAVRAQIEDAMVRARKMGAVEYEMNREALASQVLPPPSRRRTAAGGKDFPAALAQVFLKPCMPGLLQERLARLEAPGQETQPVDLTTLPKSAPCREGQCAIAP
jgi:hypothetical protein